MEYKSFESLHHIVVTSQTHTQAKPFVTNLLNQHTVTTTCKLYKQVMENFWRRRRENGEIANKQLDRNGNLHIFPEHTHHISFGFV